MQESKSRKGRSRQFYLLAASTAAVSMFLVGYAAISLTYDPSKLDVGVKADPLIWESGSDYSTAVSRGYASGFVQSTNKTYMNVTINGLPEVTLVIDELLEIQNQSAVTSFNVEISTAISGTLVTQSRIDTLKLRFWKGGTPPTDDSVPNLDLTAAQGTTTADINPDTTDTIKVQLVAKFNSGTLLSESAEVWIRITDIVEG